MSTTKEKIAVMQAYEKGRTIQCKIKTCDAVWYDNLSPAWNWEGYDYRIKLEPKLRPYKNAEEFLKAQKEHGKFLVSNSRHFTPINFDNQGVMVITYTKAICEYLYADLWDVFTWQDGTPCGIMEE